MLTNSTCLTSFVPPGCKYAVSSHDGYSVQVYKPYLSFGLCPVSKQAIPQKLCCKSLWKQKKSLKFNVR